MARQLGRRATKTLWIVHVCVAGAWLGTGLAMWTLARSAGSASGPAALAAWSAIATMDRGAAAIVAVSTLATGVVYGIWTPWGFFRHRWVTVKWVLALGVLVSGIVLVNGSTLDAVSVISHGATAATERLSRDASVVVWTLALQCAALVVAVVLSKLKPWRRPTAAGGPDMPA